MTQDSDNAEVEVRFLDELIDEHAAVAGDILEINPQTWAIHGTIGVDGDVIMAEFDSLAQARAVLDHLEPNDSRSDR